MARCKDCVHFGICKKGFPFADGKGGGWCEDFKSKSDCVPVVRCKDCKHYKPQNQGAHRNCTTPYCMRVVTVKVSPSDFCSYGERRNDG